MLRLGVLLYWHFVDCVWVFATSLVHYATTEVTYGVRYAHIDICLGDRDMPWCYAVMPWWLADGGVASPPQTSKLFAAGESSKLPPPQRRNMDPTLWVGSILRLWGGT